MCGILGSVNVPVEEQVLDLISHRGPDAAHIRSYSLTSCDVTFAHRRLSILELSEAGNQPMQTSDGQYNIIFNGEIFNHKDLRERLPEVHFRGNSDTESILCYLAKKGIEGLQDFNGNFAFAFLDITHQKLYLARDKFGVKPLYYYHNGNRFVFSSEIRPVLSLITTTLDNTSLAELLKLRYNPADSTLYKEIRKLLPGHYMTLDLKTMEMHIQPIIKPRPIQNLLSLQQAVNRYGDLFERAVERQLMSDVQIGSLLSGGVDSALVTYFAAKNSKDKLKTFTVGFDEVNEVNELNDARISAGILGTEHHEVVMDMKTFWSVFEEVVRIVEEPLGTTSSIPMYFLNKEVAKHVKVVLTGQGADEPLGGYARYQGEIYRRYIPAFLFQLISNLGLNFKNEKVRRFIHSAGEQDIVSRLEKTYALFDDAQIQKMTGLKDQSSYKKIDYFYKLASQPSRSPVEAMMSVDLHMNLADDLLLYTDKVSMHFGVETRVPILDFELIEYIESLPLKYKIRNGTGKFIHKEFARNVLPETIVNRPKKGFKSPTSLWFEQDSEYIMELLTADTSNPFYQIIDSNEIYKIVQLHKRGYNQEKQLFLLLSLFFWFKNATLLPDFKSQ